VPFTIAYLVAAVALSLAHRPILPQRQLEGLVDPAP
jgi:hypothetical protein